MASVSHSSQTCLSRLLTSFHVQSHRLHLYRWNVRMNVPGQRCFAVYGFFAEMSLSFALESDPWGAVMRYDALRRVASRPLTHLMLACCCLLQTMGLLFTQLPQQMQSLCAKCQDSIDLNDLDNINETAGCMDCLLLRTSVWLETFKISHFYFVSFHSHISPR